jgi:hypothetical protein
VLEANNCKRIKRRIPGKACSTRAKNVAAKSKFVTAFVENHTPRMKEMIVIKISEMIFSITEFIRR